MTGIGFHHNLSLSKVDIKKQERKKRLMVRMDDRLELSN